MTTVQNQPAASRQARPPLTREQLLFIVANVISNGVNAPIAMHWSELPSGREFEVQFADDDRHAVNLLAAPFGLPTPRESDQESNRGRRARCWYGTHSTWTPTRPLFGGWRIAVNCYITTGTTRASAPVTTAHTEPVPA